MLTGLIDASFSDPAAERPQTIISMHPFLPEPSGWTGLFFSFSLSQKTLSAFKRHLCFSGLISPAQQIAQQASQHFSDPVGRIGAGAAAGP